MSNLIPEPMTADQFVAVLEDVLDRVRTGDSFEGNLQYLMPIPDDGQPDFPAEIAFLVSGSYRVGNSQGQGGMRMIGSIPGI